ncbi:hypothetical protein CC85DRAFT_19513 [Cutaneotrichosporon oleaginosum]|uniref:Uncharacterized protein n=1 Tax=Cutaneotrichosporon oleaginosum TaxID=879819 RepID=A0A0J0XCD9_9TREE|nr:uncharacterized protein CC85DRAFT_19513 [Cutaneotrichosporon oleaginosum]KLT38717.1 hypothetical protein CC85DRAFT_19513 [Cutaneotrichosporon oleaginosum]TXT15452.1 hypothetical protein COLE_01645 [Cutaneotrichosporon oleaginosum]
MPEARSPSKRLSSLFAFLRPRKSKDKSDSGSFRFSARSRTTTPAPPSVAEKPPSPLSPSATSLVSPATLAPPTLASPVYDASHTSSATMSRMSGLNEVDVAKFPLPPDALPPSSSSSPSATSATASPAVKEERQRVVTRSESTPVFSLDHHTLDLTLSNPASPRAPAPHPPSHPSSPRPSTSLKQPGFLRRASIAGLRQTPKSRPQSLLPPAPIPQIDLKFDVGRMDVDFAQAKQSRSTSTL